METKKDDILKRTISKKLFEEITNGETSELKIELTPYWCKRMRGLARICPYSLPFNSENRFCQKFGKECVSGKTLRYFHVEIKQSKTNNVINKDIQTVNVKFENDTPYIILGFGENTEENNN